jgi:hypothetical protein
MRAQFRKRRIGVGGSSQRVPGGFILFTGQVGIRNALRPNQVAVVHDADECHDETILRIHGGHIVRVPSSLEEVLGRVIIVGGVCVTSVPQGSD